MHWPYIASGNVMCLMTANAIPCLLLRQVDVQFSGGGGSPSSNYYYYQLTVKTRSFCWWHWKVGFIRVGGAERNGMATFLVAKYWMHGSHRDSYSWYGTLAKNLCPYQEENTSQFKVDSQIRFVLWFYTFWGVQSSAVDAGLRFGKWTQLFDRLLPYL